MATKKPETRSKKLESFNRTQEIYRVLEKGIIESEALLNSAVDRPEDDAHIVELLESASGEAAVKIKPKQKSSAKSPASRSSAHSKGKPKRRR